MTSPASGDGEVFGCSHPAQALKVLAKVDKAALDVRHREFLEKLRAKAEQLHQESPYELADQDW